MKILTLHNRYRQRGGEDESTESEVTLMRERGHQVLLHTEDNRALSDQDTWRAGLECVWSGRSYRRVRELIRQFGPDVVKVHNFFPLLSPSIYYAAEAERVPVVQTLHNYRLLCPGATFLRDGAVCEACLGKALPWPAVKHGCYRGSRTATAAVAAMTSLHRGAATWRDRVSLYVTPSEFARRKFEEAGFPRDRLVVKPNFLVRDPGAGTGRGDFALFAGRLADGKGIRTLLDAWRKLAGGTKLRIAGEGPLLGDVMRTARTLAGVSALGHRPAPAVLGLMGEASFLAVPSECYETFGRVVIEAFAKGTPVIASNIGAIAELVEHGRTGLLFRPGDADDLAAKMEWFLCHPAQAARMRREARAEFLAKYTAECNYQSLLDIYESVTRGTKPSVRPAAAAAHAAGHAG